MLPRKNSAEISSIMVDKSNVSNETNCRARRASGRYPGRQRGNRQTPVSCGDCLGVRPREDRTGSRVKSTPAEGMNENL